MSLYYYLLNITHNRSVVNGKAPGLPVAILARGKYPAAIHSGSIGELYRRIHQRGHLKRFDPMAKHERNKRSISTGSWRQADPTGAANSSSISEGRRQGLLAF